MEENKYNLGVRLAEGDVYPSGIAYIIIPSDVDRKRYIIECYRTSTVSIFSEHNGVSNRVPIDNYSINFIEFPEKVTEFGTAVSFTADPIYNKPIIVGIYNKADQVSGLKEHQFKFKRELNGTSVEITGSSEDGSLALNVVKDFGGKVLINIGSEDNSGTLDVKISGDINLIASGKTLIKQFDELRVQTIDKDNNKEFSEFRQDSNGNYFHDETHAISTNKFVINEGDQAFLLGNKTKSFLDDLITEISNSTVTTSLGQMPLLNKVQILKFKERTKELLSEIGFIDK